MKKGLKLFATLGAFTLMLGASIGVGAKASEEKVEAATDTTVYYAVPSTTVGTYTVKLNINRKGDGDDWKTYVMSKQSRTFLGYDLYKCDYTDLYNGVGCMQFQLYNGDTHVGQQQPISSWTAVGTYNGKVYIHDKGWTSLTDTQSGTITIDLAASGWASDGADYAIGFWSTNIGETEFETWSSYVDGTEENVYSVNISYDIDFTPAKMSIVRYNSENTSTTWNSNKWSNKWNQTKDISISTAPASWITICDYDNGDQKNYYSTDAYEVKGGPSGGDWSTLATLSSHKENGSGHIEYYSTSVTLTTGQAFQVVRGTAYFGSWDAHSSIKSRFSGSDGDITIVTGGTYSIYFDSNTQKVYITTIAISTADEWAQYFLAHVGCDASGINEPTGWSNCADEYAKLNDDARDIVHGASANEKGSYVEKAVARYDQALRSHPGLDKFIVDHNGTARGRIITPITIEAESNNAATIIITTLIGVLAIGGFFFYRKKRA